VLTGSIESVRNQLRGAESDRDVNSAWLALDRFIRDLEKTRQAADRFSIALTTICESTNARLAFVYIDGAARAPEMAGGIAPSSQWCRDVTRGLAAQFPRGGSGGQARVAGILNPRRTRSRTPR
jgi:hypothetical protein